MYMTNLLLFFLQVQSKEDGRLYAVKRSAHRFRGTVERNRSVKEARNHERLVPHPHILNFVAAWEECGRLYIQTELCHTSLLLHAENKPLEPGLSENTAALSFNTFNVLCSFLFNSKLETLLAWLWLSIPDEPAAWDYLCDLLSALQHLHSQGFVHLDLKPANVLISESGCLKLGDFGLLYELKQKDTEHVDAQKAKDDAQEGDPRYMAPELLRGEYGPAADVFRYK